MTNLLALLVLPLWQVQGGAEWTSWGEWGECSTSCGEGVRSRWRRCTDGGASATATLLAADFHCHGENTEEQTCTDEPCTEPGTPAGAPSTSGGLTLVLASLATAGEHFGHALGAYTQVSMLEGAPLYEQLQEDGQGAILSREDEYWVVRQEGGQGDSLFRAPFDGTATVPASGWAYLDVRKQAWAEDATMTARHADVECGAVRLVLRGEAREVQGGGGTSTGRWRAGGAPAGRSTSRRAAASPSP